MQQNLPEVGSSAGQTVAAKSPPNMRAVQWLVERSPSEVDRFLQSLASSHNVALQVLFDSRSHEDAKGNTVTTYFASGCRASGQTQDAAFVAEKIKGAMTPAPRAMIEGWLAELSVLVARRRDDEFGDTLRVSAYSARLGDFPADVVKAALLDHKWKFWPSWAELSDLCDSMALPRKFMLSGAHRLEKPAPSPEPGAETDKWAMKAAADEIMKSFGFGGDRTKAVNSAPMARTMQEAETRKDTRTAHWSETAAPDDPRWEILRKARIDAGMIKGETE